MSNYEIFDFPNTFSWDTRIAMNAKLWGKNALFVNLDIFNLLDNLNTIQVRTTTSKGVTSFRPTYQQGRQFWIQAGYEF